MLMEKTYDHLNRWLKDIYQKPPSIPDKKQLEK